MKKILFISVVIGIVAGVALQADALEVDFTGELKVEGVLNTNENMFDDDHTSDWRKMRFRLQTEFKITDDLSVVTRFDALEKDLSSKDSAIDSGEDDDNIDFDRAYLQYISPIGLFRVGRMKGDVWGTAWADSEEDTDRILYVLPIPVGEGKFYISAVAEKVTELDKGTAISDGDNNKYYITGTYKTTNFEAGLLSAFYKFGTFLDPGQSLAAQDLDASYRDNGAVSDYRDYLYENDAPDTMESYAGWYGANATTAGYAQGYADAAAQALAAGDLVTAGQMGQLAAAEADLIDGDWPNDIHPDYLGIMSTRGATLQAKVWLLTPYIAGKWGDFGLQAELDYAWGTLEYDTAQKDRDIKGFSYFIEGTYDIGPVTLQGGFAHVSGDADYTDDKDESFAFVQGGEDWARLFILNSDDHEMITSMAGGVGNHLGGGLGVATLCSLDGFKMFYGGADYAITEDITLGVIAAYSEADDIPDDTATLTYKKNQGYEVDLTFNWQITENLKHSAIGAYLDGGDYWEYRATGMENPDIDSTIYSLYHKIEVTF